MKTTTPLTILAACTTLLAACGSPDGVPVVQDPSAGPVDAGAEPIDPPVDDDMNELEASDPDPADPAGGPAAHASYNALTPEEQRVILNKGTEWRNSHEYTKNKSAGTYLCRQCNVALYTSADKFESNCGWPSFDDEIEGRVTRVPDADGRRTEIICTNCEGHLGHVFLGEGFTEKNTRHCVNGISMQFVPDGEELPLPIVLNDSE